MSNQNNVIVYGVRRTGTSLLMAILENDERLTINKDMDKLSGEDYKDLQPFYNEGDYVGGINIGNEKEYMKLKNNLIKMMGISLIQTHPNHFDSFDKIFVMNRYWVNQNNSSLNLNLINIKNDLFSKSLLYNSIIDKTEFLREYKNDDGIEYGYNYSAILLDMVEKKYISKIVIINFETLYTDPEHTKKYIKYHGFDIGDGLNLINKDISKYQKGDRNGLTEFRKGYFDYLDHLHESLRIGDINKELLVEVNEWFPRILKNINDNLVYLSNKYKLNFTP
jgi:hypothetical protein